MSDDSNCLSTICSGSFGLETKNGPVDQLEISFRSFGSLYRGAGLHIGRGSDVRRRQGQVGVWVGFLGLLRIPKLCFELIERVPISRLFSHWMLKSGVE